MSSWLSRRVDTAGEFHSAESRGPGRRQAGRHAGSISRFPDAGGTSSEPRSEFASSIGLGEDDERWETPLAIDPNPLGVETTFHQKERKSQDVVTRIDPAIASGEDPRGADRVPIDRRAARPTSPRCSRKSRP
jgi:hypothetical protein